MREASSSRASRIFYMGIFSDDSLKYWLWVYLKKSWTGMSNTCDRKDENMLNAGYKKEALKKCEEAANVYKKEYDSTVAGSNLL